MSSIFGYIIFVVNVCQTRFFEMLLIKASYYTLRMKSVCTRCAHPLMRKQTLKKLRYLCLFGYKSISALRASICSWIHSSKCANLLCAYKYCGMPIWMCTLVNLTN